MTKDSLEVGRRYLVRMPDVSDGATKKWKWVPAVLIDKSTYIAVFDLGKYCVTYKYCQLTEEVKEEKKRNEKQRKVCRRNR